jgi:hypothetical protein
VKFEKKKIEALRVEYLNLASKILHKTLPDLIIYTPDPPHELIERIEALNNICFLLSLKYLPGIVEAVQIYCTAQGICAENSEVVIEEVFHDIISSMLFTGERTLPSQAANQALARKKPMKTPVKELKLTSRAGRDLRELTGIRYYPRSTNLLKEHTVSMFPFLHIHNAIEKYTERQSDSLDPTIYLYGTDYFYAFIQALYEVIKDHTDPDPVLNSDKNRSLFTPWKNKCSELLQQVKRIIISNNYTPDGYE